MPKHSSTLVGTFNPETSNPEKSINPPLLPSLDLNTKILLRESEFRSPKIKPNSLASKFATGPANA